MPYNPEKHHRRSIRLAGFDYSTAGAYFITICTNGMTQIFGHVEQASMYLSPAGEMVRQAWDALVMYKGVELDEVVIMPNHMHGIIWLTRSQGQAQGPAPTVAVPDVVQRFKSFTTSAYGRGVRYAGWPAYDGRLWQRNYYEHIIRNANAIDAIRNYIRTNPERWDHDFENPTGSRKNDLDRFIAALYGHTEEQQTATQASPIPQSRRQL